MLYYAGAPRLLKINNVIIITCSEIHNLSSSKQMISHTEIIIKFNN